MEVTDKSIHFDSIEEFFEETRENKIHQLVDTLREEKFGGPFEKSAWENSLPDLAKLLHCPDEYYEATMRECEDYIGTLEDFRKLIAKEDFSAIKKSMEKEDIERNVRKCFNKETLEGLKRMTEEPKTFNDETVIEACEAAIDDQIQKLEDRKRTKRIEFKNSQNPISAAVGVDIEYSVGGKRIDVLLSDSAQNKYVIIELKQWTEENIEICEDEDGHATGEILITGYNNRTYADWHPALKVRTVYREGLKSEVDKDAEIMCLVYLHNQFYEDSVLFFDTDADKRKYLYDTESFRGENSIMYTRMRCNRFRNRIDALFQEDEV